MIALVALVVGVGLFIAAVLWLDDAKEAVATVGFILAVASLVALLAMGCNRMGVGADMARIASLRRSAASVDLVASEDVAGMVADVNASIAINRWYRGQWWARDFVPAAWDTVAPIPIAWDVRQRP